MMLLGAGCLGYSLIRGMWTRATSLGLLFAATWLPAAVMTDLNAFAPEKATQLFTIGLLTVLLGCQFGHSEAFLIRLVKYSAVVGVAVAAAMLLIGTYGSQGRLAIFDLNPIGLGRITGLAAVVLLLSLRGQSALRKSIAVGFALVAAYVTFETQSQGPFGAIWIAVLLAIFLKPERRVSSMIFGLGGAAALMLYSDVLARQVSASAASDTSSLDRFELYEASWEIFNDHLTGIGWGNLYNYLPSNATVAALGIEQHSHNIVLETAVEGGIIALLGLVLVVSYGFVGMLSHVSATGDQRLMGMWIFGLAIAMTSGNLPGNRLTLLMLGVGLALYASRKPARHATPQPRRAGRRPATRRSVGPRPGRV